MISAGRRALRAQRDAASTIPRNSKNGPDVSYPGPLTSYFPQEGAIIFLVLPSLARRKAKSVSCQVQSSETSAITEIEKSQKSQLIFPMRRVWLRPFNGISLD